ncbi:acyl-CoA synthetase [Vibrio sp. SM6]|uniref:Acyl-CoA synthetase n=1 Tax=Vibrio agarilyticus TaxID=2726741 RepID=A0A7X8TPZ6_9VIBR|nr:acyl-CoA synthetase [Vibrio agarilyticus]NLS12088.1 acyl-CoA synthetase [Vibrio agarilyticus]
MNLLVPIHKRVRQQGFEMATRQAWKCGVKANVVNRVVGVVKGRIVCVIEGVRAEISTPLNNALHDEGSSGRYVFIGGQCYEPNHVIDPGFSDLMFLYIKPKLQRHRYMTDDELAAILVI